MIPFNLLLFLIVFFIILILLVLFFLIKKNISNKQKINILLKTKKKSTKSIMRNMDEIKKIMTNFYGDKAEEYMNKIKAKNQSFCTQVLTMLLEYNPDLSQKLPAALESINDAYIMSFYDASQLFSALKESPGKNETVHRDVDEQLKETILYMAELCRLEIDKPLLNDYHFILKSLPDFKEKIDAVFEEKNTISETASQYLDLVEQLRQEKNDMKKTINEALQILERIYIQYKSELNLPEDMKFKKFNYDRIASSFKLNETTIEPEKN